jgi:hypothetical protein
MDRFITRRVLRASVLAASALAVAAPGAATADRQPTSVIGRRAVHRRPIRRSGAFRDFDRATWLAGHSKDVVSIVADDRTRIGLDAVAEASAPRFVSKDPVWSWTEITRQVHSRETASIAYNTKYAIPRLDYWFTAVTYDYEHGRWLTILDQGTLLEEHVGNTAAASGR